MSAVLQDLTMPARLVPWHPALHTTLARCVLLALLLHLWLVLMLGTAPGGTARPGEGVGGRLNITLRGPVADGTAATPQPPPTPAAGTSPAAEAVPRWGGSVRSQAPSADSVPGAAQLGLPAAAPQARPQPAPPAPAAQAEPEPAEGRLLAPAPAAPPNPVRVAPLQPVAPLAPAPALSLPDSPTATVAQPLPVRALESPVLQAPRAVPVPALPATAPQLQPLPELAPAAAALPTASAVPEVLPRADPGAADAGSRIGHDVATPGSAAASAPKKLNLELARPRGGELSRWGSTGALPVLPRLPERDEKLAREIEKAGRADCTKAYREAGLAAVVPLVADALKKDGGCKW